MKILFMIPNLDGGGAEKVLVNLCNALMEQTKTEMKIDVLLLFDEGINRNSLSTKVTSIHCYRKKIPGLRFILKLFSPEKLVQNYVTAEYDLVISYLEGTMTRIASGYTGKKIAWIHSRITPDDIKAHFVSMKEALSCYQKFDKIVSVSNEVRENFLTLFPDIRPEKIVVLHNLNETDRIAQQAIEEHISFDNSKVNAVVVGKIAESKGVFRIIEAFTKRLEELEKLHVFFVGTGPDDEKLKESIQKRNLSENCTITGYQENPYKWISNADMLICPSYTEGLSTVVTEALILGVPVLTTNCGGMTELLGKSEYGLIVDNTDRALAEGLSVMANDSRMRDYYRSRALVRGKDFLKSNILDQTISFFQNTIAGE